MFGKIELLPINYTLDRSDFKELLDEIAGLSENLKLRYVEQEHSSSKLYNKNYHWNGKDYTIWLDYDRVTLSFCEKDRGHYLVIYASSYICGVDDEIKEELKNTIAFLKEEQDKNG